MAAYRQLRTQQRGFGVTSPVRDKTTGYTRRVPVRQIVSSLHVTKLCIEHC